MQIIEKDILTVENGFIFQQVNAQGIMGSGIAKAIRDKWPKVYTEYKKLCDSVTEEVGRWALLGEAQIIKVTENLSVVNIFAQYDFRKNEQDKGRYTEYGSFAHAIHEFSRTHGDFVAWTDKKVYFPYNIGSDRGGGDFEIIKLIIDSYFPDAIICKLPK